ncbi:putative transcriptional regulatory protein [Vanrija pseudolonga]|uniref:Purtative transcriptional regulatory protein n=1 Tax=Vanrija pseudolonga TaxID=143232 RepID=A0AAF0Y377_9TREE|nr:purtative transcriptional regulatory protein [Vanrija pseudolonga]
MQHRDMDERDRDRYPPVPPEPSRRSSSYSRVVPPPTDSSPRAPYFSQSPSMRDARDMPSPGLTSNPSNYRSYAPPTHSVAPSADRRPGSMSRWSPTSAYQSHHHSSSRFASGEHQQHTSLPGVHDLVSPPSPAHFSRPPLDPRPSFPAPYSHRSEHAASHTSFRSQDGFDVPEASSSRSPPRRTESNPSAHGPPPTLYRSGSSGTSVPSVLVTTPLSSNSSSSAKHPAPVDQTSTTGPKKKKRRQAFSCAECSKRKQKCNRETPCQHCVSRKVPHLCLPVVRNGSPPPRPKPKPEASEVSTKDNSRSTQSSIDERHVASGAAILPPPASPSGQVARIRELERVVNALVNCSPGLDRDALQRWRKSHPSATSPSPLSSPRPKSEPQDSPATTNGTPLGVTQEAYLRDVDQQAGARNPHPQFSERKVDLKLNDHGSFREQLAQITEEGAYATLQKFVQNLPDREAADRMIDFFFRKVNYVRYPIDERFFRKAFEAVYSAAGQITEESVRTLPLISAVLATAYRLAPAEEVPPEEARRRSLSLYWDSQFSLTISTRLNPMNIRLVETRIVLGLYLIIVHGRRLAEGWSLFQAAVSAGQILGLHRDGTKVAADLDPYMIEYRRRLWSYLCHADATFSCLLNRPPSIDPVFNDTKAPSNIDLSALAGATSLIPGKPMSETTDATYLILRKRLADIVRQIVRNFQRVDRDPSYDDVLALDAKLNQLRKDLPPQFRMNNPDKSRDKDVWYLPIHRYYIQTEILHFTIILHRPWFLRELKTDRYNVSRQACTEATRTDFEMRLHFRDDVPDFFETLRGGSLRQFMPAMVAGISLLLEPSGEHADVHRQIVDRFLEDHKETLPDGYSREEVEIVANLKKHDRGRGLTESGRLINGETSRQPFEDDGPLVSTPQVHERSTTDWNGLDRRGSDSFVTDEPQPTDDAQNYLNTIFSHNEFLGWFGGGMDVPVDSVLFGGNGNQAPLGDWTGSSSIPTTGPWDQQQLSLDPSYWGSPRLAGQRTRATDQLILGKSTLPWPGFSTWVFR